MIKKTQILSEQKNPKSENKMDNTNMPCNLKFQFEEYKLHNVAVLRGVVLVLVMGGQVDLTTDFQCIVQVD